MNTIITLSPAVVADCNRLHTMAQAKATQAKALAEEATHCAILLGIRLEEIRKDCPHGSWEGLFAGSEKRISGSNANQNHEWFAFEFSSRTAAKYMEAAKAVIANPALKSAHRKAILAIAAAPGAELGEADREHLSAATNGKTLRQLYLDFGIIKPTTEDTVLKGGAQPGAGRPRLADTVREPTLEETAMSDLHEWMEGYRSFQRSGELDCIRPKNLVFLADGVAAILEDLKNRIRAK